MKFEKGISNSQMNEEPVGVPSTLSTSELEKPFDPKKFNGPYFTCW
jgi:hypothetical protein